MHFKIFLLTIAVSILACGKKNVVQTAIIGHAGNGLTVPHSVYNDNTREAIELAVSTVGCDGIELDVQMDKMGQLWLFHDETVERTSLKVGAIPDFSTSELAEARYSTLHKEKLVQLKDYVFHWSNGKKVFLNTKIYHHTISATVDQELYIQKLLELQSSIPEYKPVMITNNTPFGVRLRNAGFPVFFDLESSEDYALVVNNSELCSGVVAGYKSLTDAQIKELKSKGVEVALSGIRSPKAIKAAMELQPDYILVDDIKAAIVEKY